MIVSIIAGLLGIFYFYISVFVIRTRRRLKISLGDGNNSEMLQAISAHSNFQAYTPILLILLFLVERNTFIPTYITIAFGLILFIGRLLHFQGIVTNNFKMRIPGMIMTLFPLMGLSLVLIFSSFFQ